MQIFCFHYIFTNLNMLTVYIFPINTTAWYSTLAGHPLTSLFMYVLPMQSNYIISNIVKCFLWLPNITKGYFTNHYCFPCALCLNLRGEDVFVVLRTQLTDSSEVFSVWYSQSLLTPDGRTQLWKKCKRQGCYIESASNPGLSPLALDKSTVTNSGEEKKINAKTWVLQLYGCCHLSWSLGKMYHDLQSC